MKNRAGLAPRMISRVPSGQLAPERKPIAPWPFQRENLVVDAIRRPAPHKLLMRSGKREADGPQSRADRNERHLKAPISRRLTLSTERSAPHVDPLNLPPIAVITGRGYKVVRMLTDEYRKCPIRCRLGSCAACDRPSCS